MSKYRKIVWNEGMLLTPHHFQQFDNYHEEMLNSRVRSIMQHEYGVIELRFSAEAIANGNFQVTTCRGVLPDGLFVNVPDAEAAPFLQISKVSVRTCTACLEISLTHLVRG